MAALEAAIQESIPNCWRLSPWMAGLNPAMTWGWVVGRSVNLQLTIALGRGVP